MGPAIAPMAILVNAMPLTTADPNSVVSTTDFGAVPPGAPIGQFCLHISRRRTTSSRESVVGGVELLLIQRYTFSRSSLAWKSTLCYRDARHNGRKLGPVVGGLAKGMRLR
jgi:hypothetical protein